MRQQLRANSASINYEFDYILRSRNLETDVETCIDYLVYEICIKRSLCRLFTASVVFDFRLNQLRNQKTVRMVYFLTYAKSALLHFRPTSSWFSSFYMHLWRQRQAPWTQRSAQKMA